MNSGTQYFADVGGQGFIAYRETRGYVFQFGGVFAAAEVRDALLGEFLTFAAARNRRVCALQVRDHDVDLYHRHGFRLNQLGASYTLTLSTFDTKGGALKSVRRKAHCAERLGVEVRELGVDLPSTEDVRDRLRRVSDGWLRTKGRHVKELQFLVGEMDGIWRDGARCFVALLEGELIGFITYSRSYGRYSGFMCDLTRRAPASPAGTMEAINLRAIRRLQEEGVRYLNFGLTPFVGVHDRLGSHSPWLSRLMRFLARHGAWLYPAEAQVEFKTKWRPDVVEPEYIAYQNHFSLGCLWQLLRLVRAL